MSILSYLLIAITAIGLILFLLWMIKIKLWFWWGGKVIFVLAVLNAIVQCVSFISKH